MKKVHLTTHQGFTLTEVMVAVAILTVLSGILVTTFIYTYRSFSYESNAGQLQLSGRAALARMVRNTQQAVSVVENFQGYTTDADTLIIRLPAIDQLSPSGYQTLCPSPLPSITSTDASSQTAAPTGEPSPSPSASTTTSPSATPPEALRKLFAAKALAYSADCFEYIPSVYDYIVYERDSDDSSRLREVIFADSQSYRRSSAHTISEHVAGFSVTYYDLEAAEIDTSLSQSKRVSIRLQAQETHFGRTSELSYTEQITLRNR